jgi:hypothetical protein
MSLFKRKRTRRDKEQIVKDAEERRKAWARLEALKMQLRLIELKRQQ